MNDGALLGAENAAAPGSAQQLLESGDLFHQLDTRRLCFEALVDLEEWDYPLDLT